MNASFQLQVVWSLVVSMNKGMGTSGLLSCCMLLCLLFSINSVLADSRGIRIEPVNQPAANPYLQGSYRALIIGNNEYRDSEARWSPLKTALSDARSLQKLLKTSYGFTDVQLLENATRKEVLEAMEGLARRAMPDDHILVYYAGHGFMDMDTEKGFWVPVDGVGLDNSTFLRNSTIRDELTTIAQRARHTLLISDSCFSGTLLRRGNRGIEASKDDSLYYEKVSQKKSVQILTAGGEEFVDDNYRDSGHSPFTYFLINELEANQNPMMTLSELSNSVQRMVANNVEQVPESGVLYGAGDELGEFIFIRVNLAVEGVDPDRVKVKVNVVPADKTTQQVTKPVEEHSTPQDQLPIPTL